MFPSKLVSWIMIFLLRKFTVHRFLGMSFFFIGGGLELYNFVSIISTMVLTEVWEVWEMNVERLLTNCHES